MDDVVARRAAKQHGLVTYRQLQDLGVSRKARRVRVDRGQWVKAEKTVIRIAGWPVTWESVLLALGEVAKTDSGFERLFAIRLAEAGLPEPVLQHEVHVRGHLYRIDLAYPDRMLGIELDGGVHMRREVRRRDYVRQNALHGAGWTLLRFFWEQYRDDWPGIVREIRTHLRR